MNVPRAASTISSRSIQENRRMALMSPQSDSQISLEGSVRLIACLAQIAWCSPPIGVPRGWRALPAFEASRIPRTSRGVRAFRGFSLPTPSSPIVITRHTRVRRNFCAASIPHESGVCVLPNARSASRLLLHPASHHHKHCSFRAKRNKPPSLAQRPIGLGLRLGRTVYPPHQRPITASSRRRRQTPSATADWPLGRPAPRVLG
ncbi:hypothetical protein EJ06DRAFT_265366 [Trichodelitschia bisporula]|uniref:Uncharacterized protein n=1 Tax=Trichodelitschia bisporula TaxID=703511 RepID=A0A6G1HIE8_9PEZI|nr:hypothetical protein EJ06DRAFT_265366 [Trichodelitschia bisporula]